MVIVHHCLYIPAQPASLLDFRQASAKFYMAAPVGTLVNDVKEAFQGSASVMKGDTGDQIFDILKKNVLGVLFPFLVHQQLYLLVVIVAPATH